MQSGCRFGRKYFRRNFFFEISIIFFHFFSTIHDPESRKNSMDFDKKIDRGLTFFLKLKVFRRTRPPLYRLQNDLSSLPRDYSFEALTLRTRGSRHGRRRRLRRPCGGSRGRRKCRLVTSGRTEAPLYRRANVPSALPRGPRLSGRSLRMPRKGHERRRKSCRPGRGLSRTPKTDRRAVKKNRGRKLSKKVAF